MNKTVHGFTIVELLVVIAVIGILTTIGIMSFTRYQTDARDSQRSAKTILLAEALEEYYDKNGEYPSCSALSEPAVTVTVSTLPGLEPNTLMTPTSASSATTSITCTDLTGTTDLFAYVGDGSAACASGESCLEWTLKYQDETSGQIKTITSRRQTALVTAGDTILTSTPVSFTQIDLGWLTVNNALNYTLQRATDVAFTANLVSSTQTGIAASATGLTAGTQYFFRIMPNAPSSAGNWSNTSNATTLQLATPVATATTNSISQITLSWPAIPMATTYTLNSSLANTFTSPTVVTGHATTSRAFTGLTPGTTYYFRTQAVAPDDTSDWSNTASATTTINPPTSTPSTSAGMSGNNAVGTASVVACTSGTPEYQLQYHSTNTAPDGSWSGWYGWSTARTLTIGAAEGYKYTFRAHARCTGPNASSANTADGSAASTIRQFNTPSAPTYAGPGAFYTSYGGVNNYAVVNYQSYCPGGTSLQGAEFRTIAWGLGYGPHPFGFNDWWSRYWNGSTWLQAGSVQYYGHYYCNTVYASSPWSPESYNVIPVIP